jgi:hypothetical protein
VLGAVVRDGGRVATFNGSTHDLPTLRMRQVRWWMCEADAVERIQAGEAEHMDVMLELSGGGEARWPTLVDACASVGFSLWGPNAIGRKTPVPAQTESANSM